MKRTITTAFLLTTTLLLGCAVYQAYPGNARPRAEVAVLFVPWTSMTVDGEPVIEKNVSRIELLPGPHVIEWVFVYPNDFKESRRLEFVAKAGKRYRLGQRFFEAGGLGGPIGVVADLALDLALDTALVPLKLLLGSEEPVAAPEGEYYTWILERQTGNVVAGMAPDVPQVHQTITYVPAGE